MHKTSIIASTIVALLGAGSTAAYAQCTLPNQLVAGDVADATKVTANFSALANCADDQAPAGPANAIQYNAGDGSLDGAPLADGQTLIGSTGNPPEAGTLTAGPGIAITNGPGSIAVTATGSGTGSSVDWLNKAAVVKPMASAFTMQTTTTPPPGAAVTETARGMLLSVSSAPDNRAVMAEVPLPAGNWQATMLAVYTGPASAFVVPTITVRDSVLNRAISFSVGGNGGGYRFDYTRSSGGIGLNSHAGDVQVTDAGFSTPSEPAWVRLARNGASLTWSFSRDGENFTPVYTVSAADYLTNLSTIGPAMIFYQPTHPGWNAGYHVLSWNLASI
ncbi:hypothetical protein B5P46_25130 [Rhizobium leguminosarum]|uniref:Uncharacterized protein n=1 Tax=Rhizobium leguminosarum TaxID=384 RepID=A0A4Q1TNT6_RHILE|nr:hypothetical protein [Rhizobium leguminosarum]RXT19598.1 hypothetical protein B5P46_25130 [Rhizobium leguminosarum]